MPELAFYTAKELIEELMRRKTFYGVVVHAADDHKRDAWPDERIFNVHYNGNLESAQASRLLNTVAEYIDVHVD